MHTTRGVRAGDFLHESHQVVLSAPIRAAGQYTPGVHIQRGGLTKLRIVAVQPLPHAVRAHLGCW
jgi:hypothetical protein